MAAKSSVRVRFAPSPTGYLHIGGVRTALYNWLWARQQGGTFVLRIEDTDRERSTDAAVNVILESMRWLGLDWDEGPEVGGPNGPYFQMERLPLYQLYAQKLIDAGAAYRCYCSAEDLQAARAAHKTRTGSEQGFKYPGTCRDRKDAPDKPFVVRLRMPQSGSFAWDDLIRGRVEFSADSQQDAVVMRNNGIPLYNLGAVVDDVTMGITLVARGEEHLMNVPQQLVMFQALGATVPQFAHMPLILNPSGSKLSKRDAAVAVLDYREQGFIPDGLLNYLMRLGWSHGDQEIFTRPELIAKFDWEHVGIKGGRWDQKKLLSVQATHLRMLAPEAAAALALPLVRARGLTVAERDPRLAAATALVQPRATTLVELADAVDYFFREPPVVDEAAATKLLVPAVADKLAALGNHVAKVEPFERGTLEASVKAWLEQNGFTIQDVAQAARVALTGRKASPGLFEVMEVLGKERAVARLEAGAASARARA